MRVIAFKNVFKITFTNNNSSMRIQILPSILFFFVVALSSCNEKCTNPPVVKAGNDTIVYNAITSGEGGVLEDATLNNSKFTGLMNHDYSLAWKSENDCGVSISTQNVSFKSIYTVNQMVDSLVWITNSCFRMKGTGVTVYIDPQGIKAGTKMADVILITHSHGDHFSTADIKRIANENTLIYGPASCKYSGVCKEFITVLPGDSKSILPNLQIKAVSAYNIVRTSLHPKSANNVGFVVTLDGVSVYHAGDTERIPEMKEIDCDIALLPLGQTYTMVSLADAAESAKDVKAEVAIPMHFGGGEGTANDANTFKTLLDGQINVVIKTKE